MPPLVATLLLFPMVAPNMSNTMLMLMVVMSLMFHTKVLPNTQNTNQPHITISINMVFDMLGATIGKSNRVATSGGITVA